MSMFTKDYSVLVMCSSKKHYIKFKNKNYYAKVIIQQEILSM